MALDIKKSVDTFLEQAKTKLPSKKVLKRILALAVVLLLVLGALLSYLLYKKHKEHTLVLAEALYSQEPEKRAAAAIDLGRLGSSGGPVIPDLAVAMKDPNWMVRFRAAEALGNIGLPDPQAVEPLIQALGDGI